MKRLVASIALIFPFVLFAQAPEVEITAEPSHHLALENEHLRVFQVEVAAHASTLMHRHRHDYMFVTLGDSHVSNELAGKPPVDLKIADGETHYTPGNFAHIARNLSDQPFRNVTIEFLEDEKLRDAPSPWTANSGPHDTTGVHAKVLFEKDGARVSQIEIDPGTTVPSHHHDGPHLMVAVSDLELSSDVEGRGPMTASFKSGDVKWLPGGYTHSLTNTGKSAARLVIVEFPARPQAASDH
jgi:quercetin dioxygenase-like cupin family protein